MKWSDEEISYLTSNFGLVKAQQIAEKLGRTKDAVHKKAQYLGLKGDRGINRKYTHNENYFTTVSLDSAYWAGFIAADGCITNGYLKIMISIVDSNLLENLKEAIKYSGPVYIDKKKK